MLTTSNTDQTPVPVQLTIEEYIVASLCRDRAFALINDVTGEAVIIAPAGWNLVYCPRCKRFADHGEDDHEK